MLLTMGPITSAANIVTAASPGQILKNLLMANLKTFGSLRQLSAVK